MLQSGSTVAVATDAVVDAPNVAADTVAVSTDVATHTVDVAVATAA